MTVGIIAANVAFWIYESVHGVTLSTLDYGVIPQWMLRGISDGPILFPSGMHAQLHQEVPWPLTILTAMFAHGGWLHLIGNMWFLWIFGDNLEDRMGVVRYVLFYLACGVIAAGTQVLATPDSVAPMVGASGAIAGVLGGYILLYPASRIRCLCDPHRLRDHRADPCLHPARPLVPLAVPHPGAVGGRLAGPRRRLPRRAGAREAVHRRAAASPEVRQPASTPEGIPFQEVQETGVEAKRYREAAEPLKPKMVSPPPAQSGLAILQEQQRIKQAKKTYISPQHYFNSI